MIGTVDENGEIVFLTFEDEPTAVMPRKHGRTDRYGASADEPAWHALLRRSEVAVHRSGLVAEDVLDVLEPEVTR